MAAQQILIKNLTNNPLPVSAVFSRDRQIQVILKPLAQLDVSHVASYQEIENNVELANLQSKGLLQLSSSRIGADAQVISGPMPLAIKMRGAGNVVGANTQTVGFQVVDASGQPIPINALVEMTVFSNANMSTASGTATLATATDGTIVSGSGTAALKVLTSAAGKFTCTLTDAVDETVYMGCKNTFGGPLLDCQDSDSVTFS